MLMDKEYINLPGALDLPFSSAVKAGDFIFISGQAGHIDNNGSKIEGIEAQTVRCMENIKRILDEVGAAFDDVVKVTIYLRDVKYYAKMNEVYAKYFFSRLPARSTAITGLAMPEMLIEIDCVVYKRIV
jgi:2-iminobutanoate/2-iminopropanoate deaminase